MHFLNMQLKKKDSAVLLYVFFLLAKDFEKQV
jgi:hypothetical protein